MKTVFIYDQMEANLEFFTVDGDYSRFDGAYVNSMNTPDELARELSAFLYDGKGTRLHATVDKFPVEDVRNGAQVVVIGFLP